MKKGSSNDLNRPIHLGRRDAFMERAAEMFRKCLQESSAAKRAQHADATLYYLHSAFEHSVLASKSGKALPDEESMILVLRTLMFYLHAVIAVMENESQFRNRESRLWRFLMAHVKEHAAEDMTLGGAQLLRDVAHFFDLVEAPYLRLRQDILKSMSAQDKSRYENARQTLKKHIGTRNHQRHAVRHGRTSCPALLAKYE